MVRFVDKKDDPLLMTMRQVADSIGLSLRYIEILIARKEIPSVRIGKLVRVRRKELVDWLNNLPSSDPEAV